MARIWRDKKLGRFRYVDWEKLQVLGFRQRLENLLSYPVEGQQFESFKKLFSIDEPVYMEMVTEFMTTYTFKTRSRVGDSSITFRYMGSSFTLSLAQFAQHLDLYTPEEIHSPLFTNGATSISISTTPSEAWSKLSSATYFSGIKATKLRDPVLQILHKLIACSFDGKYTTSGRVARFDIAMMTCILEKRNIQVAHLVAQRILEEKDFGAKRSYMGPIITRLIRRMGLLKTTEVEKFKSLPVWSAHPIDYEFLRSMDILKIMRDGTVYIRARSSDTESMDELVPGLILPREGRKRHQPKEPNNSDSDSDSDEDKDDYDDPVAPPPVVPQPTRAGPSTPAPRSQVPPYIYHYGTPPGPDYWYWLMQMQVRCYKAMRQQTTGIPVSPLPDLPCGLGRAPPHLYPPAVPTPAPHRHPVLDRGHGLPPRTVPPRPQAPPAQVPIQRQHVPSVVGSARGQTSRGSRISKVPTPPTIVQSHKILRSTSPAAAPIDPVSSHRQTDLFRGHSQQRTPEIPLDSFDMPAGEFVDHLIQDEYSP